MSSDFQTPNPQQQYTPPKSKTTRNCCLFAAGGCGCLAIIIAIIVGVSTYFVFNSGGLVGGSINSIAINHALEDYCEEHGSYPPAYTVDENGNPLHSWRVLILPYIRNTPDNPIAKDIAETQNLQELYKSIRLDEPWDSDHNKQFASKMPRCYFNASSKEEGKTNFQMVIGPKCISDGPNARMAKEVRRMRPIVVIEANPTVEWMKPQDIQFSDIEANRFVDPGSETPGVTCPHSLATMPFGMAVIAGSNEPGLYFNFDKFDKKQQAQQQNQPNVLTIEQIRKRCLFETEIGQNAPTLESLKWDEPHEHADEPTDDQNIDEQPDVDEDEI